MSELNKGYIKRIHVNQHVIKANHIMIGDNVRLCYAPESPLACGATIWIETIEQVSIQD